MFSFFRSLLTGLSPKPKTFRRTSLLDRRPEKPPSRKQETVSFGRRGRSTHEKTRRR